MNNGQTRIQLRRRKDSPVLEFRLSDGSTGGGRQDESWTTVRLGRGAASGAATVDE